LYCLFLNPLCFQAKGCQLDKFQCRDNKQSVRSRAVVHKTGNGFYVNINNVVDCVQCKVAATYVVFGRISDSYVTMADLQR